MLARAQLQPEVLARRASRRRRSSALMRKASRLRGERARAAPGRGWRRRRSRFGRELGELAVEQRGALLVERAERLVEDEQLRVVQQRPAEREPLEHAARERVGPLVARVPEPEALEQHPDPLPALGHAVQPAVEVEVLERGQLAVDERLVAEEPDPLARRLDVELAGGRARAARAISRSSVVLPEPFGPGEQQEAAALDLEVEVADHVLRAVRAAELPRLRSLDEDVGEDEARRT